MVYRKSPSEIRVRLGRPTDGRRLSLQRVREHLDGRLTIGVYALNPETQRSKWVAIDADYQNALDDLLKLQWELRRDGVEGALEKSRRGAHLWIFAERPLLAQQCRVYIYNLALRLRVPVKGGAALAEGIEVFPREDQLGPQEFGNAIRAPLGVHRGADRRYWFYGADYQLQSQLGYLERLRKITENELSHFVDGLELPEEFRPRPKIELPVRPVASAIPHPGLCSAGAQTVEKLLDAMSVLRPARSRSKRRQFGDFHYRSPQVPHPARISKVVIR